MNQLRQFILLLSIAVVLSGCEKTVLPDGGFAAKAVLSETSLQVGDVITLTLTAHHAPGSTVQFPTIGNRKQIIMRGRAVDTSVPAEGVLETEETLQLTSLRTGNWQVTTNPVVCTFADGTQKAQALPELVLHVGSTLTAENSGKLSDIKGPIHQFSRTIWVLLLVALIALVACLAALLFRKRSKGFLTAEPVTPPHITARDALAALKEEPWIPEPFFVKLSLILRTYLEDRFDLNAPESTTEELAGKLDADSRLDTENRQTLQHFFTQSDLVKFARADAEQDVMRTAFTTVEHFVTQTTEELKPQKNAENPKESMS